MTQVASFEQWWNDAVCGCLERLVGTNEAIRLQVAAEHVGWIEALRDQPSQWTPQQAQAVATRLAEQGRQDDTFLGGAPGEVHDPPNG